VPGGCINGVLWHAAYGRPGTPVFRSPKWLGARNLETHISTDGVLVDTGRPFPGVGLIALERTGNGDRALGLIHNHQALHGWAIDETMEAARQNLRSVQ
jgi:hypothetical protein